MKPETLKSIQETILSTEKLLREMAEDIAKAKKAGYDVTEQEKIYRENLTKLSLIKSVYIPS